MKRADIGPSVLINPRLNSQSILFRLGLAAFLVVLAVGLACWPSLAASPEATDEWLARAAQAQNRIDFSQVARRYPGFKAVALLAFDEELDLARAIKLLNMGVRPIGGRLIDPLGMKMAFFHLRAGTLDRLRESGLAKAVIPLSHFYMNGLYRLHFKVVEPGFTGPLAIRVTTPRDGAGKYLVHLEDHLTPQVPFTVSRDEAGNRWLEADFTELKEGQTAKFDFFFTYFVEVAEILEHSLGMTPLGEEAQLEPGHPAAAFLGPAGKIDPTLPQIQALAEEVIGQETSPRVIYRRLRRYIEKNIPYDHRKRAAFFGGQMVYHDMDEMYQPPQMTLDRHRGACPDTILLEASLFRAVGLPARTAGRWGHFYTEIYYPGRGWVSTSVTPTGIPLIIDPDHNYTPFVSWDKPVALQTTLWSGAVRIEFGGLDE